MKPTIRIESQGTSMNTKVFAIGDDGSKTEIKNITRLEIAPVAINSLVTATITFSMVELDLIAELTN